MPATVTVLDSTGTTQTVNTLPALGQVAKAASLPVALATDDPAVTALGTTADAAVANAAAGSALGYLRSIKDAATDTTTPSPVKFDQTTPGTTNAVALAQINAATVLTGNGVTGTGAQRVTIASDQTAFSVNAVQSGTWNIGSITTLPALVAGTALIGKVGIDQTTVGTTNAVSLAQVGANTILTGNGVTGTGSPRVTIASDQTAFNVVATQVVGSNLTTGDTGAKTATGNGATLTNAGNIGVQILFVIGTVSGTSPTFVGKVQGSVDGGTTWFDVPGATTASLTATGNFGIMIYPGVATTAGTTTTGTTATASMALPRTWRVVWTIGGTTPSFTITSVQYNYLVN